jgi:ABC-2 type transport system ATP-binding protein
VLLTTHDLDEASRLADHVVIIDHGRLLAADTPRALMTGDDNGRIHFGAPPGLDVVALGTHLGAPVHEASPGEYVVDVAPYPRTVAGLTSWLADHDLPLADLRAGRHSLEDVFLRLTEGSGNREAAAAAPARRRRGGRRRR